MFNLFLETSPVCFLVVGNVLGVCWSRKFSVMVIVMRMGRWSEWSAVLVSHCVLLSRLDDIVVMCGEVDFDLVVCVCVSFG